MFEAGATDVLRDGFTEDLTIPLDGDRMVVGG
jgi:hypothetical protein